MAAKYGWIADNLRLQIRSGQRPVGSRLPAEEALAQEYHVSRMTLRKAIEVLHGEGLVDSQHGVGSFVTDPEPVTRIPRVLGGRVGTGVLDMTEDIYVADADEHGFQHAPAQIRFEPAPEHVARALEIEPGTEICVREQVKRAEGTPVQLVTSYLPRELTRGTALERAERDDPVPDQLAAAGYPPHRFRETVGCRPATEEERSRLNTDDAQVLIVERIAWSAGRRRKSERPVEVNYVVMPGRRYRFSYEWRP